MNHITYPPSYFEPPEIPFEERLADWIQDDDERLVDALMKLYDPESLAYQLVCVWHTLGSMNPRGDRAQDALYGVYEMVERATKARVQEIEDEGVERMIERALNSKED